MRRFKELWTATAATFLLLALPVQVPAQTMKTVTIGGDDVTASTMIAELGALILEKDSTLEVGHVMAAGQRPSAYKDVDVQVADIIGMVNGKRTRTVTDLDAILDSAAVGEELKLGIRRGKEMRLVAFKKADPKDLPQMKMMTVGGPDEGEGAGAGGPKIVTRTIGGDGSMDDFAMLMGSGLVVKQDGDAVVIADLMPDAAEVTGSTDIEKGDRVLKLQGKSVTTAVSLQEQFDAIAVGDKIEFVLARDGKEYTLTFDKTPPRGRLIKRGE